MTNEMINFNSVFSLRILFLVALQYKNTNAVPPDYCFHQLNKTDCNVKPTPVFHYYQPAARCELALWRGCPTYNMFKNEYECSNTCIYRFRMDYNNTPDYDWEEEIKKIPNEEAVDIIEMFDNILSSTYPTSQAEGTKLPNALTDVIETTAAGTTALDEKEDQIPTNDPVTTTSAKLDETTVMTTENGLNTTTNNVITTTNEITTDKIIKTDATDTTTQLVTEATSTAAPTTVTMPKGNPDEVDIMRKH